MHKHSRLLICFFFLFLNNFLFFLNTAEILKSHEIIKFAPKRRVFHVWIKGLFVGGETFLASFLKGKDLGVVPLKFLLEIKFQILFLSNLNHKIGIGLKLIGEVEKIQNWSLVLVIGLRLDGLPGFENLRMFLFESLVVKLDNIVKVLNFFMGKVNILNEMLLLHWQLFGVFLFQLFDFNKFLVIVLLSLQNEVHKEIFIIWFNSIVFLIFSLAHVLFIL